MPPPFAAFPLDEHRERFARARRALMRAGFDGCVSVAPEHLYYLGGYDSWVAVNSPQALIFDVGGGEPILVLRDVDLPLARETSWLTEVRTYRMHAEDPVAAIANATRDAGLRQGRLAIESQSYALTHALGRRLADALAPATLDDATDLLGELRVIKSAREMGYLRRAASHAEAGLAAFRAYARAGTTEIELAGRIEAAMRGAGGDYWAIPTELAGGPRAAGGHATPRGRRIERGDLIHAEFAGVERRYHAVAIHSLAVGAASPAVRELYEAARASLAAGIGVVAPGAPVEAIEEASLVPLRARGLEDRAMMRFGYGIGIAYPPIWLETLQISRGARRVVAEGMVFVLHACLELADEGLGVVQGGTYALTEEGLEMLVGGGDVPLEIAVE
ncbi:MAG: Xaa-Pro peptidase family protein [Alphaproteobacteria bacterium]